MKIVQTPYIDHQDRNRLFLKQEEGEAWVRARLSINGWEEEVPLDARGGEARAPRVDIENSLFVQVWDKNGASMRIQSTLKPVKEWKVGFILSSHEDLGYEDYANQLGMGDCILTELAMDLMDAFPDYRYFIEHIDWLRAVENYGGKDTLLRLEKYIKSRKLDVGFPHSGVHTHWHGAEQLARSTVYARECGEKYGVAPKTVLFADISGMSWAAVGAYAQAGVRYVINAHNRFRDHRFGYPIAPLFWWQAPNGKDRVLFWTQEHYLDINFVRDGILHLREEEHVGLPDRVQLPPHKKLEECVERFAASDLRGLEESITDYLNSLSAYPWEVLPVSFYIDRELPPLMPKVFCDSMADEWKWPEFSMRTPTDIMAEIEERYSGVLPTYSGDLCDQWSDAMTASPIATLRKRRAERYLPAAETLQSLTGAYDSAAFDDAMYRMCSFDEHCWATGIKDPIGEHRFNQQYVKEQNARVAQKTVFDALSGAVPKRAEDTVTVFWPVPEDAALPVRVPAELARGRAIQGKLCQKLYDGSVLSETIGLAAFGARSFLLDGEAKEDTYFAAMSEGHIVTDRYDLLYDAATGRIKSLKDLRCGREIIDGNCPDALGDFLFLETVDKLQPDGVINRAQTIGVKVFAGPLAVSLVRTEYEPQSQARITTSVTLYRDMDRIDVESGFEGAVDALMGSHAERYRKNIFYAFPLKICDPRFMTEMPICWIDETTDRLPFRAQDFVIAKDAVRVEERDGSYGLMVVSPEMPVFHLGGIHYQQFNRLMPLESSHVYVYAASNRCSQLAAGTVDECRGFYRFSLLPYTEEERCMLADAVDRVTLSPIVLAGGLDTDCLIRLDAAPTVRLCAFRPAGQSGQWLVRVRENAGCVSDAAVCLPFEVKDAHYADIDGRITGKAAKPVGRTVLFAAEANAYTTLIVSGGEDLVRFAESRKDKVRNVFSYPAHEGGTVVCWEKAAPFDEGSYTILADGKDVLTVDAEPWEAQFVVLPIKGEHAINVVFCRR